MDADLERVLTEQVHAETADLDRLGLISLLTLMNRADSRIPGAVSGQIPQIAAAVEQIVKRLESGGRLFYIGAGTSGRLGVLDASECPPTFGVPADLVQGIVAGGDRALRSASEGREDDAEAGAADLRSAGCSGQDVVVGISASGRTPYVLGALKWAREQGTATCGISCVPTAELSKAVGYPIEVVIGPEILTGSTRLGAGTATKLVLNMISTAVMVRLGHVYGNLMVNVAPSNAKLQARARRIVRQATGLTRERSDELFDQAGRNVRVAIVMGKLKVGREEAERLLAESSGRIRDALSKQASSGQALSE